MRALLALILAALLALPALARDYGVPISVRADQIRIIDGDTVRPAGQEQSIRLVGFNAGEKGRRAHCPAEIEAGKRAQTRLRELLNSGPVTLTYVRCACRPGTENTQACNFGRACGSLHVARVDVGQTMISEGIVAPYVCGKTSCPRAPKPWCSRI